MSYNAQTFCYIIEVIFQKWYEDAKLKESFNSLATYYEVVEEMKMPKVANEVELYMANHFQTEYKEYFKSRNTAVNILNKKYGK